MFGDFQCPACRVAEPGVEYAMKTYSNRVRFVWDDYPLTTVHPNALPAAIAARCAEEQGKFWEFHDQLYSSQPEWEGLAATTDTFTKYAGLLGLKTDAFTSCIAMRKYLNKIEDDQAEGNSNRVQATPTFFIGNKRFEGGLSNAQWDQEIQGLLKNS
jgi:protein-disulfide isomerase